MGPDPSLSVTWEKRDRLAVTGGGVASSRAEPRIKCEVAYA